MFNWKQSLSAALLIPALLTGASVASAHSVAHHTSKKATTAAVEYAHATLVAQKGSTIHGTATLTLNTKTDVMTVVLKVEGMKAGSLHPDHIHSTKTYAILYTLKNIVANKMGDATETTVFKGVKSLPKGAWMINVHQGPKLMGSGAKVAATGKVVLGK